MKFHIQRKTHPFYKKNLCPHLACATLRVMTEQKHQHLPPVPDKTGILIVNLGTPQSPKFADVRRYLKVFLSDRRVIEKNRFLWWLILNGPILTFAPIRSGRNYATIWNKERNESPLLTYTRSQSEKLANKFDENTVVRFAMRYSAPSIEPEVHALKEAGCQRILVVPLYPQYSAATTASVCDATFDALGKLRWMPTVRIAQPFYKDDTYIEALANSMKEALKTNPEKILFSYHGLPQSYFDKGDPYPCHCRKTTRLACEKLGLDKNMVETTFQSRYGREEWLKPYTEDTLKELAAQGIKNVAVISPAFISDCVETLHELDIEARETFMEAGGETFTLIPCLNDNDESIDMLENIIRRDLW